VTEEPSVIAACSNGAKMAKATGGFVAKATERLLRGQIVFTQVASLQSFVQALEEKKEHFYQLANEAYPSIVVRGGGVRKIEVRTFANTRDVSLDVFMDTQEAMGANMLNTVLEAIANEIKEQFTEQLLMSILSNYATEAVTTVCCRIPFAKLSKGTNGEQIATKIAEAARYAKVDIYRATTHNKGNGSYQGLSDWYIEEGELVGELAVPILMASVGGATTILPKAHAVHEMLGNPSAQELAYIAVAVGLAQNLAALRALVSEGIQQGHMALQARSLAMSVGANAEEIDTVVKKMTQGEMNQNAARLYLQQIRQETINE